MSSSSDEDRALLDAYREATSPSAVEVEQALTRTLARIESSTPARSWPGRRRRLAWVAAAGLATLAIATGAIAGVRWLRARPQPEPQEYGAAQHDRVELDGREGIADAHPTVAPPSDERAPAPAPVEVAPAEAPEVDESAEAAPPRRRARSQRRKDATSTPTDAGELAEESRLLARVRRALDQQDFEAALDWAEEHASRHPGGALTEERLILEAVAACRGGLRERGHAALGRLREQFPKSPAITRVEQACAD